MAGVVRKAEVVVFWKDAPSRLKEYAGWYFPVYVHVHLLRRESCTHGLGDGGKFGWLAVVHGGLGLEKSSPATHPGSLRLATGV